jgi:hypothetical protein
MGALEKMDAGSVRPGTYDIAIFGLIPEGSIVKAVENSDFLEWETRC